MAKLEGHRSLSEIIGNLKAKHSESKDAIDQDHLYEKAFNYLKTLGHGICMKSHTYVDVKDYVGAVPPDFRSVIMALSVNPESYTTTADINYVKKTKIYHEYIYPKNIPCKEVCQPRTCDFFEVIEESIPITINYSTPRQLNVVDHIFRDGKAIDSVYPRSEHSIEIYNNSISASFKNGKIAMAYWALPMDEDGVPMVPETRKNDIASYIEKMLEITIMEHPKFMKTNPEYLKTFYQSFAQEARMLKMAADVEAKGFTLAEWKNLAKNNNKVHNNHRSQIPI
jgi:hypothetical protein